LLLFAVFVLSVYGLANGATVLKARLLTRAVLGRIPIVGKGVSRCPACFAFWAGGALSLALTVSPASQVCPNRWAAAILDGLVASGTTWLLHVTQERLRHGVPEPD
jgi:hypothetical protein